MQVPALEQARTILSTHRDALEAISKKLVEVETLERDDYETLLKQYGVEIEDAYIEDRKLEEKVDDPSKSLETPIVRPEEESK